MGHGSGIQDQHSTSCKNTVDLNNNMCHDSEQLNSQLMLKAMSASIVEQGGMRWYDFLWAGIGFGFSEPHLEDAYKAFRSKGRSLGMTLILGCYMVGLLVSDVLLFNYDQLLGRLDFLYVDQFDEGATRDWMFEDWYLPSRLGVQGWFHSPVAVIQTLFFPCMLCWEFSAGNSAECSLKRYNRFWRNS